MREPLSYVFIGTLLGFAVCIAFALFCDWWEKCHPSPKEEAEKGFLAASAAWWAHVDEHGGTPVRQDDRVQMTRLNIQARETWHRYKEFLPEPSRQTEELQLP